MTQNVVTNGSHRSHSDSTDAHVPIELSYPQSSDFQLQNHPIDKPRRLKVVVIGAGLSGIIAGVLLPPKVPGIDLKIYEKNLDVVSLGHTTQGTKLVNLLGWTDIVREAPGSRTSTQVYAVIYRPMSIRLPFRLKPNGPRNSLKGLKF